MWLTRGKDETNKSDIKESKERKKKDGRVWQTGAKTKTKKSEKYDKQERKERKLIMKSQITKI